MTEETTVHDVPAHEYGWDAQAEEIMEALQRGEAVPGWRLVTLDGVTGIEHQCPEGGWPTDEP